jgi:hypothetical protein
MLEIVQWIIVAGAGGVISVITQIVFFKPNKRIKDAEANNIEFELLKKQIDYINDRIDKLREELGRSEEEKKQTRRELDTSEIKRYKLKSCISAAHGCSYKSNYCPVLKRQRELDEEWEKEKEKNNREENNHENKD